MNIGTPQIILIVLWTMSWTVTLSKNGQPREDNYSIMFNSFAIAIQTLLLWWGGFFS